MSKISYSAVVLDDNSANRLKREFESQVPDSWKWYGHHMTIKMGELPEDLKPHIGTMVSLLVTHLGNDERAMAVKVTDNDLSTNKIPHITLAVNVNEGGKPFHSNKISEELWQPVTNRFTLTGKIEEIPHK